VLKWMCERLEGKVAGQNTPIGILPIDSEIDTTGLSISEDYLKELLRVDSDAWRNEIPDIEKFFAQFGDRLPVRLHKQLDALKARLV
jgi:phosphoenolpyruvate carboxykinase (GTP)